MNEATEQRWFRVDLHVHTPASTDHAEKELPLLDILHEAEARSLDIVGLVDHNTVRGYEQLRLEMSRLSVLKEAGQVTAEDEAAWSEYQRLMARLLILPGFELTTREGIHLLAVFPPETAPERLYGLLLNLGIPMERLHEGSPETRGRADIPAACTLIAQAGGLVIAAHADAPHGLNLAPGDAPPHGLLAMEMTVPVEEVAAAPLPSLWSSNAHCRQGQPDTTHPWGVGERHTEVLLDSPSFAALKALLVQGERGRLRFPERERLRAYVEQLRREGAGSLALVAPDADAGQVYRDVAALANSGGGILLIGLTDGEAAGVEDTQAWSSVLLRHAREQIDPTPTLNLELLHFEGKNLIRVEVRAEASPPYVTREGAVYVRKEGQARPANRQELLELVGAGTPSGSGAAGSLDLPQAGVEIVGTHLRDGVWFYDVRDLRVTSGVTRQRAKGLWAYAIERHENLRQGHTEFRPLWKGDRGIWRVYRSGERRVFDLVHRDGGGRVDHIFYGVSEWGLTARWREIVESLRPALEEEAGPSLEEGEAEEREPREYRPARAAQPREAALPAAATAPAESAAPPVPVEEPPTQAPVAEAAPAAEVPIRPSPDSWGGRLPRWRNQAAVELVHWEGNNLFFDLAMRQADGQIRYFRRVHRNQLVGAEGWVDLVRVPLPPTGVEVVRSTVSGDEILYQFRDMQTGRVDPRVRRAAEFSPDSPYSYAIRMYHQDIPLDENKVRWWGNIGYMRPTPERVDLIYRDEEGRDHLYYGADRRVLEGEWRELLQVWKEE